MSTKTNPRIDGVRMAILTHRLEGIARKMANTLLRSGRSGVLNIARDFSCCIMTRDHELLATADSLPIHVLSGPDMMAAYMRQTHPVLRRGDAFLHNSPYHGCSHPADHTILIPVIDERGEHHFTVLAKAHQADCGNSQATTYMGSAKDVYEEGALIFPMVQVQRDYQDIDDIVRMCRMRIRVPDQWWGDYLAMMGAARIGERELLGLAAEVGWDTLHEYGGEYLDYSERRMADALSRLPAGEHAASTTHDPLFPGMPEGGVTIGARVQTMPGEGRVVVDLTDNPDSLPCGLNLSEACARTAALVGVFNSIEHTVPKNSGSFRRVDVRLREGCVVGIPVHPTSCSVATTNFADRVANAVQTAFAGMSDAIGLAECGALLPPSVGVVSGKHPRTNKPFVNQVFLGFTGGAGAPHADCWQTIAHVGNAGLCFLDSVELDELRQPLYVHRREFVQDSEGSGRFNGARSMLVEFGPVGCDFEIGYVSDGGINGPKGVRGGLTGARSRQRLRDRSGALTDLPAGGQVHVRDGERVLSYTSGGGGFGTPLDRDPQKVAHDVAEGYVSPERARTVFGVCLDEQGRVDAQGTARTRAEIARLAPARAAS